MGTILAKLCTNCGLDVSAQKRVKDAQGRYYCHPCWNAQAGASQKHAASSPTASVFSGGDLSLDDLSQLEATGTSSASVSNSVTCYACRERFPRSEIHNHEGHPVCMECLWKVATPAAAEGVGSDRMKECPHCAERIQAKASKCPYCGESLKDDVTIPLRARAPRVALTSAQLLSPNDSPATVANTHTGQSGSRRRRPLRNHPTGSGSGSGAGGKPLKRILLVCGGVMVLCFGMIPFLGPSESDKRRDEAVRAQIEENRATGERTAKQMEDLDKEIEKDTKETKAENRRRERLEAEWVRTHQSDTEPDVRKAWPGHPFSSDADGQKVYDRIRRMNGN